MRDPVIDLILVEPPIDSELWTFYSPQLPGLSAGRNTAQELLDELPDILEFYGYSYPGEQYRRHTEYVSSEIDDIDLVIRVETDGHQAQRERVYSQVKAALAVSEQRDRFTQYPRNRIGNLLVICAIENDYIGRIASQLDQEGDSAVVCATADDHSLWVMPITNDSKLAAESETMEALGWDYETTIGHIFQSEYARQDSRRVVFA